MMAPSAPPAPRHPPLPPRLLACFAALAALAAAPALCGCSHAWDDYDPRLLTGGTGGSAAGSGGSGGVPGTGTTTSSTGAGGAGGAGGTGAGGSGTGGMDGTGGAGAGSDPNCPNGHIVFADAFDDGVIGPEWQPYADGVSTITEEGGAVVATMPSTMTGAFSGMHTIAFLELSDCAVFTRVSQLADPTTHAYTQLVARAPDNVGYIEVIAVNGHLMFKKFPGGVEFVLESIPYDAALHAYWRLRESAGVTYWETSPDAQTWETHASDLDPIPLDAVQIVIGAGTYVDEQVVPGSSKFEGLNVP